MTADIRTFLDRFQAGSNPFTVTVNLKTILRIVSKQYGQKWPFNRNRDYNGSSLGEAANFMQSVPF